MQTYIPSVFRRFAAQVSVISMLSAEQLPLKCSRNGAPRRLWAMLILKYFVYVGTLLSALLYGWCEYLKPPAPSVREGLSLTPTAEVFRPTPAPPVARVEELQAVEQPPTSVEHEKP